MDEVRGCYREKGIEAEVLPFIEDMARAYTSAALVIARAGATTLSEMCVIGRPSILIPYPYAAESHQEKNAAALEQAGAAVMIREQDLDAGGLAQQIRGLLDDPGRRRAMGEAARRQGRPDAAAMIVDDLHAWLGNPAGHGRQSDRGSAVQGQAGGSGSGSESDGAAGRRPKVKRCQLRVREVDEAVDAAADAT